MAKSKINDVTEQKRLNEAAMRVFPGKNGDRTSASGSGARFARITAKMAMPGRTFPMSSRAHGLTGGARMAWAASVMTSSDCVLP